MRCGGTRKRSSRVVHGLRRVSLEAAVGAFGLEQSKGHSFIHSIEASEEGTRGQHPGGWEQCSQIQSMEKHL